MLLRIHARVGTPRERESSNHLVAVCEGWFCRVFDCDLILSSNTLGAKVGCAPGSNRHGNAKSIHVRKLASGAWGRPNLDVLAVCGRIAYTVIEIPTGTRGGERSTRARYLWNGFAACFGCAALAKAYPIVLLAFPVLVNFLPSSAF